MPNTYPVHELKIYSITCAVSTCSLVRTLLVSDGKVQQISQNVEIFWFYIQDEEKFFVNPFDGLISFNYTFWLTKIKAFINAYFSKFKGLPITCLQNSPYGYMSLTDNMGQCGKFTLKDYFVDGYTIPFNNILWCSWSWMIRIQGEELRTRGSSKCLGYEGTSTTLSTWWVSHKEINILFFFFGRGKKCE